MTPQRRSTERNVYVGQILDSDGNGKDVAVKKIPSGDATEMEEHLREVEVLQHIAEHPPPNIQAIHDYIIDDDTLYIVSPLYDCTLEDVFTSFRTTTKNLHSDLTIEDELSSNG